ncbi:hypothetical protein V494_01578 [Pseudogymnoascus sp. VKM F-4513 (FW-928)]|nr:hypothetical protein V494_01578 [Pseudogymnoascus sp. VKM F-4513 (FW-928)]
MSTNPSAPLWLTIVRGIQLLFALVTLALSAHALATVGNYNGFGLNIFTSIVTLFYMIYIGVTSFGAQAAFNIWISVMFQAFLAIFWLATFGTLAALAVAFTVVENHDDYDYDYNYSYSYRNYGLTDDLEIVSSTTKASTALSAFVWVSFVATLIYTGTSLIPTKSSESFSANALQALAAFRNRSANNGAPAAANQEHKMGPVGAGPTPTSYQPVQQYGQQPQYAAPYAAPGAEYPPQQQQFQRNENEISHFLLNNVNWEWRLFPRDDLRKVILDFDIEVNPAYPQQTGSPAPYQQAGSPEAYQQPPAQYPQQTGSPAQYPQQTGSPAPPAGYVQQTPYPPQQQAHMLP